MEVAWNLEARAGFVERAVERAVAQPRVTRSQRAHLVVPIASELLSDADGASTTAQARLHEEAGCEADGREPAHKRCASHQCLPKEQQHALLAHGSFVRAVGGGHSELEAQRRLHNQARRPVLELALRQPSWMSPKIRAPAPASDVHGREYRARPSGHERDAERTERACADCAAAGGRRTGDRKGGCLRTEAGERTPTAAQPERLVSAASTQKRLLLDFVPKGQSIALPAPPRFRFCVAQNL